MFSQEMMRKILIMVGLSTASISEGYIFGQSTGMNDNLMSKDSDVQLSVEDVSWIASIIFPTGTIGCGIAAVLTERFGRRRSITMLTAPLILHWIILYYARHIATFIIARTIAGVAFGGVMSLIFMATAEYMAPNERAMCLTVITAIGPCVGGTIGQMLSVVMHWRNVALIATIPTSMAAIFPFFWVESPSWLASKGRFVECEAAFRALHGYTPAANKELELLITIETNKKKNCTNNTLESSGVTIKTLVLMIKKKYFWDLLFLTSVMNIIKTASGKFLYASYAISLVNSIIKDANVLIIMLILNTCLILGCCLSTLILSKLKVRTLLFSSGITGNIILSSLIVCLYLDTKDIPSLQWVNVILFALYIVIMNAGVNTLIEGLPVEMYPLEIRAYCIFIFGIIGGFIIFISVKVAPSLFLAWGFCGLFSLNVAVMSLCLLYLWIFLPETKGKTLQEIEIYFKNQKDFKLDDILNIEETLQIK
ncbi:uncharacterized protein ACR2FA_001805 [Aphomia sociella]